VNGSKHNYGFNGKEEQDELGLEWHDFGARNYDGTIGRWMSPDPLSEEFSSWSPYNSMMNNPINFIDPDGRFTQWVGRDGEVVADDGIDNGTVYFVNEGYEFNGDTEELTENSTAITENFMVVADSDLVKEYVVSQLFKGLDGLDKSFFSGGIFTIDSNDESFAVSNMIVGKRTEEGITLSGSKKTELNPTLTINYDSSRKNELLSNVYNTRNTLEHESAHYWNNLGMIYSNEGKSFKSIREGKIYDENQAMDFQVSTPTHKKTTSKYKSSIQSYRKRYKK
jgi:RHS repeat-associated protein